MCGARFEGQVFGTWGTKQRRDVATDSRKEEDREREISEVCTSDLEQKQEIFTFPLSLGGKLNPLPFFLSLRLLFEDEDMRR